MFNCIAALPHVGQLTVRVKEQTGKDILKCFSLVWIHAYNHHIYTRYEQNSQNGNWNKNDIIIIVKINSQKKNINYRMNNEWKNVKVN